MAINKSLLNNSDSIENIQQSLNSFGASLRAANNTSSVVIRKFYDANRKKKEATTKMINLSMRRREAVRRREQESIIESGKVGGILRRTSKVIGDSTKGLLGRIMDFVVGNFRIDQSPLGVVPSSLEIASGDSATLLFKIDYDAPSGGLAIEVRTNVPDSVVMPEASIAEGDRTVNIPIQGGAPGEGKLIITAPGYDSVEVPVRVF